MRDLLGAPKSCSHAVQHPARPLQPFGSHDMGRKPIMQGLKPGSGRTNLIGQGLAWQEREILKAKCYEAT